ncbi:MAG: superoxide dismutase [Rubrimonas sp.]|uniref:superoxide dismutase n=1 Tax=Rubrimonas sp. TaxID=2036015 RepID=UPI002FDE7B70
MTILSRRTLLGAGAAALTLAAAPLRLRAADGPHALPPLPYAPEALEPAIDALTMTIHHDRHHAAYVANLNKALADHSALAAMPLHELLAKLGEAPEGVRTALRNNGGGHANHAMFWEIMGPQGGAQGGAPEGALLAAIDRDLGGVEKMKADLKSAGLRQFGSGWAFVTVDGAGKLAIAARPNQDTPLMEGGRALMGVDVWEHAYYLKYQNKRGDYLDAWFDVIDWAKVAARYDAALTGALTI